MVMRCWNIDSTYIDTIFGEGKNGIRERAWLRFQSGHLNIGTLRMANTSVDSRRQGQDRRSEDA